MASLIKLLIEIFGGFVTGVARSTGDGVARLHEGLSSAAESAFNSVSELIFEQPFHCFDNGCAADTFATAVMAGGVVFLGGACVPAFRWSGAGTGGFAVFFTVIVIGRLLAQ